MTAKVIYTGKLGTALTHMQSGTQIKTDAPVDNNGLGQSFSPTDLLASSLASCMLTIMGIKARDKELNIEGATAEVTKVMASNPRRVAEILVVLTMPANNYSDKERKILTKAADACPVHNSLHPDIKTDVSIIWS